MPPAGAKVDRMTCHQFQPYIVDLARDRAGPSAEVEKHLRACADCSALLERERTLSAGLRRLALDLEDPANDHEPALLAAFDAAWTRSRPASRMPLGAGLAAAAMMFAALLTWRVGTTPGRPVAPALRDAAEVVAPQTHAPVALPPDRPGLSSSRPPPARSHPSVGRQPVAARGPTEFIAWPGAAAWPPFESGELIRVELAFEGGVVEADVLVGQDGFARAVRLVE